LSRDGPQPGPHEQTQLADHAHVLDVEFAQHAGTYLSARPHLAFNTWWKWCGPNRTNRASAAAAPHAMRSPSPGVATRLPSTATPTGRWPTTSVASRSARAITNVRSNSVGGETGDNSTARCRGDTTVPRADTE